MGSYVSRYECEGYHNVTLNCTIDYTDSTNTSLLAIGDIQKGEFEGDPDIAGVGIFATFLAVSGTALLCSVFDLSWRLHKFIQVKRKHKTKHTHLAKLPGPTDFLEAVVQSCSDTQVFTGAAYAITLRYFRGCSITAYHYNIVANMMLLTCATHLMSITVVKDYWKYPWLALVRVLAITGVFLVTGMLLANQNADIEELPFPTEVPPGNETDSYLFMTAACFQSGDAQLLGTLNSSFANGAEGFEDAIFESKPGNKIEGWNKFLVMLLWYGAALLVEIFSFFRRGARRGGKRSKVTKFASRGLHRFVRVFFPCAIRKEKKTQASVEDTPLNSPNATESEQLVSSPLGSTRDPVTSGHPAYHFPGQSQHSDSIDTDHEEIVMFKSLRNFGSGVHFLYMVGGAGICIWTVVMSAQYMIQLRYWVQRSGWLARDGQGVLAEEDSTTFGQLVPICMSGLILFSIVEMLSRLITRHKDIKYNRLTHSPEEGNGRIYRPSTGTISEAFESTRPESTRPTLHHYSKVHSSSISSPPVGSTPDTPTPFSDHSTLLQLGGQSEVTTPQPTATSDVGNLPTPLGVVPERTSTPQPTASLGEMISEASVVEAGNEFGASQPEASSTSRVSTPTPPKVSFADSTPRPSSTVPVKPDSPVPTTEEQAEGNATSESVAVGVAVSSDEPPRTPSPMTPTKPPPLPSSSSPAGRPS